MTAFRVNSKSKRVEKKGGTVTQVAGGSSQIRGLSPTFDGPLNSFYSAGPILRLGTPNVIQRLTPSESPGINDGQQLPEKEEDEEHQNLIPTVQRLKSSVERDVDPYSSGMPTNIMPMLREQKGRGEPLPSAVRRISLRSGFKEILAGSVSTRTSNLSVWQRESTRALLPTVTTYILDRANISLMTKRE
jgi:hypothetical protein